jgi:SAM-dependent methyltransferase
MGMHPNDRSRLTFMVRYATRHPDRIVPHARRLARDTVLRLKSRDHVSYYRAVMKSDAARSNEAAVGSHTHESWLKLGQLQFDYLVSHGLKPGMRMLEIGCGNLRAGRLFIEHLDAGDYYGIDISPDILLAAQRTLAETGLQGRLPHLTLVNDLKLAFLPAEYFDVVHAHSVFSHSPAEVVEECLAHVGRVMKPGGFFDFTFDRTDGAEHHVLREDFYYRTETLVALAGRYGLAGQFMTDWEELPHQQSKLRVTRPAELRYISFREADWKGMRWRRPTGVLGLMGHRRALKCRRVLGRGRFRWRDRGTVRRPALLTAKGMRSCSAYRRRSPRGAWTTSSSTSGCGRLSSLARTRTWTSCSPTCPRRRPGPGRPPWLAAAAPAGSRSR